MNWPTEFEVPVRLLRVGNFWSWSLGVMTSVGDDIIVTHQRQRTSLRALFGTKDDATASRPTTLCWRMAHPREMPTLLFSPSRAFVGQMLQSK